MPTRNFSDFEIVLFLCVTFIPLGIGLIVGSRGRKMSEQEMIEIIVKRRLAERLRDSTQRDLSQAVAREIDSAVSRALEARQADAGSEGTPQRA